AGQTAKPIELVVTLLAKDTEGFTTLDQLVTYANTRIASAITAYNLKHPTATLPTSFSFGGGATKFISKASNTDPMGNVVNVLAFNAPTTHALEVVGRRLISEYVTDFIFTDSSYN
ncbi:hypothetical protein, partial [Klebsiella pneumoniae]|uniref:hypothetical protein n=1 Tax=Klebsiella pneumoniae TaxID=573 RepID=UPI00254D7585